MTLLSILGWILTMPVVYFLAKSGSEKIIGTNESVGNFQFMKLEKYRVMVGVSEIAASVLLMIPATSLYGLVLISSLMGGAVALHLSLMGGNKTWFPVLMGLLSIASYLIR